jgi:hypothetical protein
MVKFPRSPAHPVHGFRLTVAAEARHTRRTRSVRARLPTRAKEKSLLPKIIVFSGHGKWALGKDQFVQLPAKCSMKFYTMNAKLLSDGLGGGIDRGRVIGLEPDQEGGPFSTIPNMRLYPPTGLNIRRPDPSSWRVLELPCAIPADDKNIQIQIQIHRKYGRGGDLETLFKLLQPAIRSADSVIFLWAACREIGLKAAGGEALGVNVVQR